MVHEGDRFTLDVDREFGSVLVNGGQMGLAGSIGGVRRMLTGLASIVGSGGVTQVDGYVASEPDADFFGYRSEPRDAVDHRTFYFEYERESNEREADDGRERLVGPTLSFHLLDPFRLRDGTVEHVVPQGVYYKAVLEKGIYRSIVAGVVGTPASLDRIDVKGLLIVVALGTEAKLADTEFRVWRTGQRFEVVKRSRYHSSRSSASVWLSAASIVTESGETLTAPSISARRSEPTG